MAEEQQLIQLLRGCLDPSLIRQSEEHLQQLKKSPTFVQTLLTFLSKGVQDPQLLTMALSTYSNFLESRITNPHNPLPDPVKELIRSTIVDMYFSIDSLEVAVNLYRKILKIVIAAGFPWPGLNISDPAKIQANILFYRQVAKIYQFLAGDEERKILDAFVIQYFPIIEGLVEQILQNYNDQTSKMLLELLKTFQSVIHIGIPQYLRNFSNISKWILYITTILQAPLEPKQMSNCWKSRAVACKIVVKFFQEYSSSNSDNKLHRGWSDQFVANYSRQLLTSCLKLFNLSKSHYISDQVSSNILKVFYFALKNQSTRAMVIEGCEALLFDYLLPVIDIRESDVKLFEKDPIEFVRREEDLSANIVKRSAIQVVEMLSNLNYGEKSFLIRFVEYAAVALTDPNVPFQRKDTVLKLLARLKTSVLNNDFLRKSFSTFVVQYCVPFLKSSIPIILSTTCQVLAEYLQVVEPDQSAMQPLVQALYQCLLHPSLVIRYKAILAFTSLLSHQDAINLTRPHFSKILQIYIKILDEMDHEKLLKSLGLMVSKFGPEIAQVGGQLINHLALMFHKYSVQKDKDKSQDDDDQDSDRSAIAALTTIKGILNIGLTQNVYLEVSAQLIDLMAYTIENSLSYMEEVIQLFAVLTYKAQRIADYVFPYLLFRKLLEGGTHPSSIICNRINLIQLTAAADEELHDEILAVLKNLVRQMPIDLLNSYPLPTHPALLLCLIENKLLRPDQLTTIDTRQVDSSWASTLQAYSALIYNVGQLFQVKEAIESVPKGVSLYPWIRGVDNPDIFALVIRKVLGRIDEEESDDDTDTNTMSMLNKYAQEEEDELEDGEYTEAQQLYSYLYKSPFDPEKDVTLIHEKLRSIFDQAHYEYISKKLTKNEVSKLQKLIVGS